MFGKLVYLPLVFLVFALNAYNQTITPIPDSLRSGADAVYRKHITRVEWISTSKYILRKQVEVTILNENGREHSDFYVSYDSDSPVSQIKADLFDANGKKIKSFSGKDIKDISLYSGTNLFDDSKLKQLEVYYSKFPYTVIFEFVQEHNAFINFPNWYPHIGYRVGVEYASYTFICIDPSSIRYKLFNLGAPTEKIDKMGNTLLSWAVEGLKPMESEPFSPKFFEISPSIFIVPKCFNYKGTSGCFTTWEDYGAWVNKLLLNRSELPPESVEKIKKMVEGVESEREKVKILYKYMQNRTRYVSIQLGIGGFQPFPASTVESTGYGDCKALVNYTKSLLSYADIKSHYCEIGVNSKRIMFNDFPSPDQTNHIILCVPLKNDTLWLECTSQHMPFGYLPYNLQNQKVVLIDEDKGIGQLTSTPVYPNANNRQVRQITFDIDSLGNGFGSMKTTVIGGEIENLFPELWQTDKEREEIINKKYSIPGFRLESFTYSFEEKDTTKAIEEIKMTINKLASKTGERFFVKANPFGNLLYVPTKSRKRRFDLVVGTNLCHEDIITYNIPKGYKVEALPKSKTVNDKFGVLEVESKLEDNKFTYRRVYSISKQRHPAAEFNNYIDFLMEIVKADNQNLVLVKMGE